MILTHCLSHVPRAETPFISAYVSIAPRRLDGSAADPWPDIAKARAWLAPIARRRGATRSCWSRSRSTWCCAERLGRRRLEPRIETTQSLARALGAGPLPAGGQSPSTPPSTASPRAMLQAQLGARCPRPDPRAFDHAVARWWPARMRWSGRRRAAAAAGRPLGARPRPAGGAGGSGRHRACACAGRVRVGRRAARRRTDALFALPPAAWIVVQAGGAARWSRLLDAGGGRPAACGSTPTPLPGTSRRGRRRVSIAVCADFEDEAQRSAAHVIEHLNLRRAPVALSRRTAC